MKFYPPVFGYKPSFDCDKGDKHKMEVAYTLRIDENGNDQLDVKTILKRETVGKFLSAIIFYLGFIVTLFGKRAWHDSLADTKVIKVK